MSLSIMFRASAEVPLEQIWTDYGWIRFMYESSLFVDGKVPSLS